MKKWAYFVLTSYGSLGEKALDELGKEGWELVAVTSDPSGNSHGYLKREIK